MARAVPKVLLDELKAALEAPPRRGSVEFSESDYKRKLVAQINHIPGAHARRIEDRYAVGILDLIVKLPELPMILAEGKVIDGFVFGPTGAQFEEGKRWEAAGVQCLLIGWKVRRMYISPWTEKADLRTCFTVPDVSYADALWKYLT